MGYWLSRGSFPSFQPSFFSKTGCFPWGSVGFWKKFPGKNGEVSPRSLRTSFGCSQRKIPPIFFQEVPRKVLEEMNLPEGTKQVKLSRPFSFLLRVFGDRSTRENVGTRRKSAQKRGARLAGAIGKEGNGFTQAVLYGLGNVQVHSLLPYLWQKEN